MVSVSGNVKKTTGFAYGNKRRRKYLGVDCTICRVKVKESTGKEASAMMDVR